MLTLLATLRRLRLTRSENGFTLLELLIVLIVIAILAGMAIPLFLNQQRTAVDASVKSDVRNTVAQVQDWVTRNQGKAAANSKAYADAKGLIALTRKGDTVIGVQVKDNGSYTVCGFDAGSNSFKTPNNAWGFDSTTGKFAAVVDTMAQPACNGAVDANGNDISTDAKAPAWQTAALLHRAERTKSYSVALSATGIPMPTFALASGSELPAGLTLDSTASVLSGRPTTTGRYQFTLNAVNPTDSVGRKFTLIVAPEAAAPEWNTGVALGDGQVDKAYRATLDAVGNPTPTYAVADDSQLPAGLSLNSTTGVLSGTPTAEGNAQFTVNATNSEGTTAQTFFLNVQADDGEPTPDDPGDGGGSVGGTNPGTGTGTQPAPGEAIAPEWATASALGSTEQASAYTKQLDAGGNPAATYALASGAALPAGLKLSAAGVLSGTPSEYGDFSFRVIARNSEGSTARTFTLSVLRERIAPAFTTAPALPNGEQKTAYSADLNATGYPAATYSLTSGAALPAGLTLDAASGKIAGTPTEFGAFSFGVSAHNSEGTATRTFTLTLASERVSPVFTTPAVLADGEQGETYNAVVTASGNPAPTYALADGSNLPAGLSLNATSGAISGTPTVYGTFSFAVVATNSKDTAQRTFNLKLAQHRVAPEFTTAATLAAGEQNSPYNATVAASGVPAASYALASGSDLPAGLSLNATSGAISGTPTVYGSFSFTVDATNSKATATRTFTFALAKQREVPAFTTDVALTDGEQGETYAAQLAASGEPAPTYALADGSNLPAGLSLTSAGLISGTPSVYGNFMVTVDATNSKGQAERTFFVYLAQHRVAPAFTTNATLPAGEQATGYSTTVTASGVPAPTFKLADGSTLPSGLSLSAAGVLSGTPTVDGTFSFSITAANSKGEATRGFTLVLAKQRVTPAFVTPVALSDGEQGEAYSAALSATGEPAPTYAVAAGSDLPAGLSLNATSGVISGTPTVYGNFMVTVNATNSKGADSRTFFVYLAQHRVAPAFTTDPTLAAGEQTVAYSASVSATGVPAPTYALAAGSNLPAGLSLSGAGAISGTPTVYGSFSFAVVATNSKGTDSRTFTLVLAKQRVTPTFTTGTTLADGEQGEAYSGLLSATGEPAPTYAVTGGSLPTGMTLNGVSGALAGTPTVNGTFSFEVTATNSKGTAARTFTLTLAPTRVGPAFTTDATLSDGEQNAVYSASVTATGVPAPTYTLAAGSNLPAGLGLNSSTGAISGTPTVYGTFSFTVTATNSKASAERAFTVTLAKQRVTPAFTTGAALASGEQGEAYTAAVAATGEPAPTYALASGSTLPDGLSLNSTTGAISGTPTVYGAFSFTVVATNSKGADSRAFNLNLAQHRVAPAFTTASALPSGEQASAYTAAVTASGVPTPTYALASGSTLPDGLTLNATSGAISGTPSVYGNFAFTVTATNSKGSDSRAFSVALAKQRVAPVFTTTAQLADGEQASAYSATIAATGEPAPTYAVTAGALPAGLSLDTTSGVLAGTPTVYGSFTFTITATNSKGSADRAFTLVLAKTRVVPAFTTGAALPDGEQASAYSATVAATGEPAPTYAVTAGALPAGVSLNATSGAIAGTPTVYGSFAFTITATNSKGSDSRAFTLALAKTRVTPTFTTGVTLPDGEQATAYTTALAASGEPAPTFALASGSNLPSGLSLSSAGVISGTPSVYGNFTFTVTATNSKGTDSRTFFLYLAQQRVVPAFTTGATLSDGEQATAYSATLAATGVPAPVYSLASGSTLPTGLSLNSTSGEISGTPTVYGTFSFTITAANSKGSDSRAFSLTLAKQRVTPTFTSASALAAAEVASPYSATVTASGEPAPTFALASGSTLPSGLSLSAAGVISGTPTADGTFSFGIVATNSKGSATSTFSLTVAKTRVAPEFTSSTTLTAGEQNSVYNATVTASGEPAPTFALTSGSTLPSGLSLSSAGAISGTPTVYGTFSFSITATNSKGSTPGTFSLTIAKQRVTPAWSTAAALPDAAQNAAYSTTVVATGEPNPTYAVTAGALPSGLSMNGTSGVISGTPTVYGNFSFTITATNTKGASDRAFTLYVARQAVAPAFTTAATLPTAQTGTGYSQTINASGYPDPTYAITSGSLPSGYSLNATTGVLSGSNTTAPGTYTFTVKATNTAGNDSRTFTLQLNDYPTIQNASLASGQIDSAYSQTINYTGTPTPTVSISGQPSGLSYSNGAITGTPTASGTFSVTITATNSVGTATKTLSMTIAGRAATPTNIRATKLFGNYIEYAWDASSGASSYTVTLSGATTNGATSSFSTTSTSASGYIGINGNASALNVSVVAVRSGYANSTPGTGSISTPGNTFTSDKSFSACPGLYYDATTIVNGSCAITSYDGKWTTIQQGDGNFVTYYNNISAGTVKYFFATNYGGTGNYVRVQADGNMVIYNSSGTALRSTATGGNGTAGSTLTLGTDGNMVLSRNTDGGYLWATFNNRNGYSNTSFMDWVAGSNITINNAGAESDTNGNTVWGTYYTASSFFTTSDKHDGNRSWENITDGKYVEGFINGVCGQNFTAGEHVMIYMWVKGAVSGEGWNIAGRTDPYAEGMSAYNFTTTGPSWQLVSVMYTVPNTSTNGCLYMQMRQQNARVNGVLFSDSMSIYRNYPG